MRREGQLSAVQGAVLVARDGSVLHEAYHGLADLVTDAPVTDQTRFQIASVSKQFTAAAVLLLCQDGLLSPGDGVTRWFPRCPRSWERITVHHLLTHTSGLGHWPDYRWVTQTSWEDSDRLVEAFYETPPHTAPETEWCYSSPGYVLLAKIVERAAGVPYPEFLQRRLFVPLGMENSSAGTPIPPADLAQGHDGAAATRRMDLDVLYRGAGDVWSTACDLLRWDSALANGSFLSEASRSLMFTPHARTGAGAEDQYGYGWALGRLAGHHARYHTGDNPGFRAINASLTDLDVHVVVLSNQERTDPHRAATDLLLATVLN